MSANNARMRLRPLAGAHGADAGAGGIGFVPGPAHCSPNHNAAGQTRNDPFHDCLRPQGESVRVEQYRGRIRVQMTELLRMFRSLTGLRCQVCWFPDWPGGGTLEAWPACFAGCHDRISRHPQALDRCHECVKQELAATLKAGRSGHRFTCFLGVHNEWQPIIVRRCTIGLAFLQVADGDGERRNSPGKTEATADAGACVSSRRSAKGMSRGAFGRVARLLRLMVRHAEILTLADLREAELVRTRQALASLQRMARESRKASVLSVSRLSMRVPVAIDFRPETHSQRIAHNLLQYIRQHYAQPITLKRCSETTGLNMSYLSHIFSDHLGLPFKSCLIRVRLDRAMQLLSDPARNMSEVASAVGYASENRFRIAFKKATGLPPRVWRETLRARSGLRLP